MIVHRRPKRGARNSVLVVALFGGCGLIFFLRRFPRFEFGDLDVLVAKKSAPAFDGDDRAAATHPRPQLAYAAFAEPVGVAASRGEDEHAATPSLGDGTR